MDHSGSLYQDTYLFPVYAGLLRGNFPGGSSPHEGYRMWYLQWIGWKIGPQATEPYRSHGANDDVLWDFPPNPIDLSNIYICSKQRGSVASSWGLPGQLAHTRRRNTTHLHGT